MANASVALATARTFLNDDNAELWSDAILIPKLQEAHRELQAKLWREDSPAIREESTAITVAIGIKTLGASLPADLITPISLMETTVAGTAWIDMTEVQYIDATIAATATLIYWCWREGVISFLGSTAARDVKVLYRKLITLPTVAGSAIGITFGELYIAARTAAFAAGSVGNKDSYDALTQMANNNLGDIIAINRGR